MQATKSSWTLLNTALELPGPAAVLDPSSQHVAVPIRRTEAAAAKPDSLLVWPRSAPSGRLDAFPAIELTGKVAAVHPISGFLVLYKSGGCSHVVQGQGGLLSLRDVPDSLGDGGSSGVHVCSTATSEPGVAVVTAASSGDLEVCFISTDGGGLTRRMAEWKLQSTGSPHARPVSIAAVPGKLVLLWSDLTWQVGKPLSSIPASTPWDSLPVAFGRSSQTLLGPAGDQFEGRLGPAASTSQGPCAPPGGSIRQEDQQASCDYTGARPWATAASHV